MISSENSLQRGHTQKQGKSVIYSLEFCQKGEKKWWCELVVRKEVAEIQLGNMSVEGNRTVNGY